MAYTDLDRRRFKARERWAAGKRPPSKKSPEYRAWHHMKMRCLNPKDPYFHCYGGRGITVCAEWIHSFSTFLLDMGHRPSTQHSLERVNNDDGYKSSNCVWALPKDQSRNKRDNKWLTHNDETLLLVDWAFRLRVAPSVICTRLARGWSIERALSTVTQSANGTKPQPAGKPRREPTQKANRDTLSNMDLIDEAKLQAAADEVVNRASAQLAKNITGLLAGLDGWTLTVTLHAPPKKSPTDPQ